MPAASTEIADRARKSPGGRSTPNRNFCYDFLGIQKNLINRSGFFGSPGRATAECSAIELLRNMESGGDLLSRTVTSQVPSALKSLTSVFGMGTGGTSSSLPPEMVSYLGNRFSFCPLGLPYQRFHRPFIGTVWPLPSSFSSSSGAHGRFTHPDNCTATIFRKI